MDGIESYSHGMSHRPTGPVSSGPDPNKSPFAVASWDLPHHVEVGSRGQVVRAFYEQLNRPSATHSGPLLIHLLRIPRIPSPDRQAQAVAKWVQRFGLLELPWDDRRATFNQDQYFVRTGSTRCYNDLAELLTSTLRIHEAIRRARRPTPEDTARVAEFLTRMIIPEALRVAGAAAPGSIVAVGRRLTEPLPYEHTARSGDVRGAWRRVEAQRTREVFNLLVRLTNVRPVLTETGALSWSGGPVAAIVGSLQASMAGATPFGVCGFCGAPILGRSKSSRLTYRGKPAAISCDKIECRRARQALYTRVSRAKPKPHRKASR